MNSTLLSPYAALSTLTVHYISSHQPRSNTCRRYFGWFCKIFSLSLVIIVFTCLCRPSSLHSDGFSGRRSLPFTSKNQPKTQSIPLFDNLTWTLVTRNLPPFNNRNFLPSSSSLKIDFMPIVFLICLQSRFCMY